MFKLLLVSKNGDTFPDLFVICGGNERPVNATALLDRLFLNDGKGHFTIAENAMSVAYENKSCVSVSDIDNDGDQDIFIGNLGLIRCGCSQFRAHLRDAVSRQRLVFEIILVRLPIGFWCVFGV